MPRTRKLTGIAAVSAASLASVAVSAPAAANDHCLKTCVDEPGSNAFIKITTLLNKSTPKLAADFGLEQALLKIGFPKVELAE